MKIFILFIGSLLIVHNAFAQTVVEGVVKDASTGETLIGVNIVYGRGLGTVTDEQGFFSLQLNPGNYTFTVSYVGYESLTRQVTVGGGKTWLDFELVTMVLSEVEVVGDMARIRETPVAFTTITPVKLEEQLASQDIPMILNKTPGVYATQQGGGDGDARINIRGFSQRNVAVMIDGIPVNDMENGWVYWSNWFGLDMVTQRIQVQRGLGASKLALPSIGGTMNIITSGIQQKRQIKLKQEVANDGYFRTSVSYTSGQLPHGWGVTAAASFKTGDGWVDRTFTQGWFYYLKVDKKLGNHIVSLAAMGAPQEHGQRRYKKPIATYDLDYAGDLGISESPGDYFYTAGIDTNSMVDKGLRYNSDWGKYTDKNGNEIVVNDKVNYYHKPLITLRDFWNVNERLYLSNILYLSLGNGGGTSLKRTVSAQQGYITADGQIDMQKYYDINTSSSAIDPDYPGQYKSWQYIRSNVNNHNWIGLLSTFDYELKKNYSLSGGLDLRRYVGTHYEEIYDLLGGDYTKDSYNKNRDPRAQLFAGDKINYHDDGMVQWGGFFAQFEMKEGKWSFFANLTGAYTGYKKIDYFAAKTITVGDTTLLIEWGKPVEYEGVVYDENSPGVDYQQSDWKWIPGFTFKIGANYNLTERSNIFINTGYLDKAPRFNNVYDRYSVRLTTNIQNEKIAAIEGGYTYNSRPLIINANTYYTVWQNAPGYPVAVPLNDDETGYANIQGMDALHYGMEVDLTWKMLENLEFEGIMSLGDWRWTSTDSVQVLDDNNQPRDTLFFDAQGVHVGDAAQTQFAASLRYEPIRNLYFTGQFTYFTRYYADFDPFDRDPAKDPASFDENGDPIDSWQIPSYYLFDLHGGYTFKVWKLKFDVRASVMNLLNTTYITDATDNDGYSSVTTDHDAKSAGVFFGMGRRFNTSLTITF